MTAPAFQQGGSLLDRPLDAASVPRRVLVAGATGGIGRAFCEQVEQRFPDASLVRLARNIRNLPDSPSDTLDLGFDITDEDSIIEAVGRLDDTPVDWLFVATGWLHGDGRRPEKTYKQLSADNLALSYQLNAIGPALLVKHLVPSLATDRAAHVGILSARVGSISDNRLGGWHAYRASKAALNMLIKNFAIEWSRNRLRHVIVGLQPGTTDTALSAPFQRNVPADHLQTPQYTASQLAQVMQRLRAEDSGGLFDFLGLPFEP
ncbi:MAG: SDR family NAD(P)-dependent oxidoreductase [Chromatiaceae bacterium]|jgi:NAD(P)-dependent dehydrogenase (short-subunit alcohol dehydrogenase family)